MTASLRSCVVSCSSDARGFASEAGKIGINLHAKHRARPLHKPVRETARAAAHLQGQVRAR